MLSVLDLGYRGNQAEERNVSEISHSIVHALSARGHLRWFSFLPAVCLHLGRGLYVRCGAVLVRCGPIWSDVGRCGPILARCGPMGSDVVISRTARFVIDLHAHPVFIKDLFTNLTNSWKIVILNFVMS